MKATIICDNETWTQGIPADQEFACLVEAYGNLKIQNLRVVFKQRICLRYASIKNYKGKNINSLSTP